MADPYYCGPRIEAYRTREETLKRIQEFVTKRAAEIYAEDFVSWAKQDETLFPTLNGALTRARFEAKTLFNAMGSWAAVTPGYIDDHVKAAAASGRLDDGPADWKHNLRGPT